MNWIAEIFSFTHVQIIAFIFVLVMILLDVVSGFAKALMNGTLSSTKMRTGLWHKLAIIFLLVLGIILSAASGVLELGFEIPAIEMVAVYIVVMEVVSILENIKEINPGLSDNPIFKVFDRRE